MKSVKQAVNKRLKPKSTLSSQSADYQVLIIGAGIAGIGMASRLQQNRLLDNQHQSLFGHKISDKPTFKRKNKSAKQKAAPRFVVLEKRADLGGTWDLFQYPGVRSDSDALTFGYSFRPWLDHRILAKGDDIKSYIADTARELGVTEHIRYQHEVQQLSWSSATQLWTATVKNHGSGEVFTLSVNFVVGATGYYDYEQCYQPHFERQADFQGRIVHPQHWQNVDYDNKKVVIIGSGATAMTLLPAMVDEDAAQCAQHVTMLQRSPTYVASVPGDDYAIEWLSGKFSPLSKEQAYKVLRTRNVLRQQGLYQVATRVPSLMKLLLNRGVKKELKDSDVDIAHFMPDYNPWEQRVCAVPDSDFFKALHGERAAVITEQISHFTQSGIMLDSGRRLDADIIVTATGLKLQMLGGAKVYVDGQATDTGQRMTYKAVLVEDVPNMAALFGYTNASWTLKIDLACQYVVRLLRYMHKHHYQVVIPKAQTDRHKDDKNDKSSRAVMQPDTVMGSLSAGYVKRAYDTLPKQGDRYPWYVTNNYVSDHIMLKYRKIKDDWLRFSR